MEPVAAWADLAPALGSRHSSSLRQRPALCRFPKRSARGLPVAGQPTPVPLANLHRSKGPNCRLPRPPRSPSLQPFDKAEAELRTGLTTGLPGSGHGRCDRDFGNCGLRTTGDRHDPLAGTHLMVTHLILLALAVALFVYLGFAMFKPEAF